MTCYTLYFNYDCWHKIKHYILYGGFQAIYQDNNIITNILLVLQREKKVLYKEGGSNGERGSLSKSTDALLLVLSGNDTPAVKAWCLKLCGQSIPLFVSSGIFCGALMRPKNLRLNGSLFHPLICSVEMNGKMSRIVFQVQDVYCDGVESTEDGVVLAQTTIDDDLHQTKDNLTTPSLAMGSSLNVLVLCHDNVVVTAIKMKDLCLSFVLWMDPWS